MSSPRYSRGSGSGCFIRFLGLIILGYLLLSWIPRCVQQLPQMAANTAAHAASGATGAAGNAASSFGRGLLDRLENWWSGQSPAAQFNLVCEHLQVEGVDKLCPYFTAAVQGATEAQAAQTSCYLAAAGTGTQGPTRLQQIHQTCPQTFGNVSAFQSCVESYVTTNVEPGEWSSCMASSEQQFKNEVHTMTEPIACIPGLPKSWCTTGSSATSNPATGTSSASRTDANYTNCLQRYYLSPGVTAVLGTPCGSAVNAGNAACVSSTLQTFTYAGQNLGQQYVQACADPVGNPP